MTRNEENGYCCGAGGGVSAAFPGFARWAADERLREAESTGAEAVVSPAARSARPTSKRRCPAMGARSAIMT